MFNSTSKNDLGPSLYYVSKVGAKRMAIFADIQSPAFSTIYAGVGWMSGWVKKVHKNADVT